MAGRSQNPESHRGNPQYFVIGRSDGELREQGVKNPARRRALQWATGATLAAGATYVLLDAFRIVSSVGEFFGLSPEKPSSTGVISELTVNLSALRIRTSPTRTENIDPNDHSNEISYFDIDSLGREANGSGKPNKFDPNHPTVTLRNVPMTSGYNPDTGSSDTGVWLWVPVTLKSPLTIPSTPLALTKDGWVCFSLSQQTKDAISIPQSALDITTSMNPNDPRITEVIAKK